jgi:site-specific DNA-adenine methylase
MKSLKTPLRYPGGKSRACVKMSQYLPDLADYTEYRDPFLGGGSFAIWMTQNNPYLNVWVNDLYYPLYNFWCILRDRPQDLYEILKKEKEVCNTPDLARGLFNQMKVELNTEETPDIWKAAAFYIINKCSFSGLTESSSFSAQASESNFSMNGIEKLPGYSQIIQNWKITNLSYEELLSDDKSVFTYLDPPYDIKDNLYGRKGSMHKGFDHDKFAADCDRHIGHQMISYNTAQIVKDRFLDYRAYEFDLTYTMRSVGDYMKDQQDRKELLLLNYVP